MVSSRSPATAEVVGGPGHSPQRWRWLIPGLTLCCLGAAFLAGLLWDGGAAADAREIHWVDIPGGSFTMGSAPGDGTPLDQEPGPDEGPPHQVTVPSFQLAKTETTVAQYRACVEADACTPPRVDGRPAETWGRDDLNDRHPVNKVSWDQAVEFCAWAGGRLPSEAEWEHAAKGAGQDLPYAWGTEAPSCERAVFNDYQTIPSPSRGCGAQRPAEVCSRPHGNTPQGLCDMGGNLWEWVQDGHHHSYEGAPTDGSPWETPGSDEHPMRGAGFTSFVHCLRTSNRRHREGDKPHKNTGFRCARSQP